MQTNATTMRDSTLTSIFMTISRSMHSYTTEHELSSVPFLTGTKKPEEQNSSKWHVARLQQCGTSSVWSPYQDFAACPNILRADEIACMGAASSSGQLPPVPTGSLRHLFIEEQVGTSSQIPKTFHTNNSFVVTEKPFISRITTNDGGVVTMMERTTVADCSN